MIRNLTDAMQDYLKEIHKLRMEGRRATTSAIAERMGVRPPSVTAMLKRLASLGLAKHAPYRGVELTPAGERVALEVIRHHRLLEQYLAQALGQASFASGAAATIGSEPASTCFRVRFLAMSNF